MGGKAFCFYSPVLKVPRQCPLLFLVEVCVREDDAFRSEKV
jgi:hypothetical protein